MTMHKALHHRDDVARLYASRREEGRGFVSIEDSVEASIQRLEDYIQMCRGRLIAATRNKTNDTKTRRTKITRKQPYRRFKRLISDVSHEKTWTWIRKGNLKRETESLLIAAQNNAIRTNHIKARIDKTQQNSRCWLCDDRDETINHIISKCSKLALKEYKTRCDWVVKVIHWELCKRLKFDHKNKWYMHNSEYVLENDTQKLLWDFELLTDHLISARRPDLK